MKGLAWGLAAAVVIGLVGCTTPAKQVVPDSAVAVVPASGEQLLLGKHRSESIFNRWSDEDRARFTRKGSPLLAVRTLGLTPDQLASLSGKISNPESAVCVVIWDTKAEKIVGSECYVLVAAPPRGETARFSSHTARYVGSL